jgi:hypothetical protein
MAARAPLVEHSRTVERVSHEALVRVDRRVKEILSRREASLVRAQLAARRLSRP